MYKMQRSIYLIVTIVVYFAVADPHGYIFPARLALFDKTYPIPTKEEEKSARFWIDQAQKVIEEKISKSNTNVATNVIMFLGDGMSIPTLKAARVHEGQRHGYDGEANQLSFEKFPYSGLSKTYCTDSQVPDSACTATAYLCGVKTNINTIGVTANVSLYDCEASLDPRNRVTSIARWSQLKGKRTGVVTTTTVTHASPSGNYASSAHRFWESDDSGIPPSCDDIAKQLVLGETGRELNVVLGGGRRAFYPSNFVDEEGTMGSRLDGRNLIEEWLNSKPKNKAEYVWNRSELLGVSKKFDYLLGLFDSGDMKFHHENDASNPTLEEMTEAAIKVLSKGPNGFFLFVEGGLIDYGHHANKAQVAMDETIEMAKAVQKAVDMTSERDTLIVVTSDHGHVMSISGYPKRGNDILGYESYADDGKPYSTLSYPNGPGYKTNPDGSRYDFSQDDFTSTSYTFPSGAPLPYETHSGDDVGIFARGPWAHLFSGVLEQSVIPHAMAYASCVGYGKTACDKK